MRRLTRLMFALVLAGSAAGAHADIRLPKIFTDHMVLQQEMPIAVWGWADAGENVSVSLAGKTVTATADASGKWLVKLPALKADGKAHKLVVKGKNTVALNDVLLGEVWLCAGQSNMNREVQIKDADPNIRLFWIEGSVTPQQADLGEKVLGWTPATPEAVAPIRKKRREEFGNPRSSGFAEVGYVFGKKIHAELGVPVGLIKAAFGGSQVRAWTPKPGIEEEFPFGQAVPKERGYKGHIPGLLYQSMVLGMVPMTMRGVVWYQGENDGRSSSERYAEDMTAWIKSWRELWDYPEMPFYYAQIAPTTYASGMLRVWEAQVKVMHTIPHTGLGVSNDIYLGVTSGRDVVRPHKVYTQWPVAGGSNPHPPNKHIVAGRLANIALVKTYAKPDRVLYGPMYDSHQVDGAKVVVKFKYTGGGLTTRDGKAPTWFELSDGTKDGRNVVYHPAEAKIVGEDAVEVTSDKVKHPKYVRFGWDAKAHLNLMNKEKLPAVSFRVPEE